MPMDPLSVKDLTEEVSAKINAIKKIIKGGEVQDALILDEFEKVVDVLDQCLGESTGVQYKNRVLERVKGMGTPQRSDRSSSTSTLFSSISDISQDSPRSDNSQHDNNNSSTLEKREYSIATICDKLQEYVESLQLVVDDLFGGNDARKREKRGKF
jgi:hypothetical protein